MAFDVPGFLCEPAMHTFNLLTFLNRGAMPIWIRHLHVDHRLNGSSSPVLTATCLSYGSLCDFLTFFPEHARGQTVQPILTQQAYVNSRADVPFAVKVTIFCNP